MENEFLRNARLLRRCNKIYNTVTIIYALMCGIYALTSAINILVSLGQNPIVLAIDGIILKIGIFVFGFLACYRHETKFTLFACVTALISSFFSISNILIIGVVVMMSVLTAIANKNYKWLENQFGFPQFNERFEEQNLDKRQREIKDEFQQNYENYQKQSSDSMQDIDGNHHAGDMEIKNTSLPVKMDDI